jgi:hypothetical protein
MQRVKVMGVLFDQRAVKIGRFVEFAAAAQRMRRLQRPFVIGC